jgi:hypothetical protein
MSHGSWFRECRWWIVARIYAMLAGGCTLEFVEFVYPRLDLILSSCTWMSPMIWRPLAGFSMRTFRVISHPFKPFLTFSSSCKNLFFKRTTTISPVDASDDKNKRTIWSTWLRLSQAIARRMTSRIFAVKGHAPTGKGAANNVLPTSLSSALGS